MNELLLKASFAIGIAFLFYKLLLQQESFFAVNRFYLVGCLALAFALPFAKLPKLVSHQGYLATVFQPNDRLETRGLSENIRSRETTQNRMPAVQPSAQPESQPSASPVGAPTEGVPQPGGTADMSWVFWLTWLYLFGVAVFTLSLLFQVGTILYKIMTATDKVADGEGIIVSTGSRQAPCSFFKYIFIYPDDYDFETYAQIIAHEKIHARLGHSFDLLMAELAVIVLWFNPFVWFFKREIEKNIEYQTDAVLLEKERVSRKQYQLNLLQIAVPNKPLSITTNYNQSLLKQRIMMMNAKKSTPHAYWKYTFLAPLFFGTLLLLNEPATSQELPTSDLLLASIPAGPKTLVQEKIKSERLVTVKVNTEKVAVKVKQTTEKADKKPQNTINFRHGDADMSAGYWYSHQEKGNYCLEFKGSRNTSNWNMSECFDKKLFQKKGNELYTMTREAGTLQLTGALEAEVSQGKYTFTEDPAFKKYLTENQMFSADKNFLFHLFFGDVNRQYVDFLKKQYQTVAGERLLELAIHGITLPEFQKYVALFQKYSNKQPTMEEVVEARIHGIDQEYVQQVEKMGFKGLSLKKIMEAKIHDVDLAYVESLKNAGFANLSMDKVIEAKIHDLNPGTMKELRALGFGELSLDKMMELTIHEVNAGYVKELQAAGLKNLTPDQILEARIHDLNAASIKEIQSLGFKDLDFQELINAQIHDVDAAYVANLKKAGFPNLSIDKAVEAKIHDIDADFIKQAKQKGYNFTSLDKYITLKIHGMAIESLKEKD